MKVCTGLPWAAVVLTSSAAVGAQATVTEDPQTPQQPASPIRAAARERRSISLSDVAAPATGNGSGSGSETPEFHTVERGDTLWGITGQYFQNPWQWPGVWGLNPQITNPHWIFPGDQVRLLQPGVAAAAALPGTVATRTQSIGTATSPAGGGITPSHRVAPHTVFLREQGWIDDHEAAAAGTVVGSPDDQMLLSEGDRAYLDLPQRTPHVGEQFTIYQSGQSATGSDRHHTGHVVRILGTATVESWDVRRHVATARITESLDTIERGERVAAMPRQLNVVPPLTNSVDLVANIVATVHPRALVGQDMVVFLDRGTEDQVQPGNRLFVVRRGDAWSRTMTSLSQNGVGTGLDRDGDGNVDTPPGHLRADNQLPEEQIGEVLVLEARAHSATALVTSSVVEVEVGDRLEMRHGY